MSFFRHEQIYHPMRRFLLRGRLLFRLRPRNSSSDESAASYSLAGCTPALPASALPAVVNPEPAGWNCQPPPHKGWGISDRRYGEFSTGVDTLWERAFFQSEFTHHTGTKRLTSHPGGFSGLWTELARGGRKFPLRRLVPAKETLQEFIARS